MFKLPQQTQVVSTPRRKSQHHIYADSPQSPWKLPGTSKTKANDEIEDDDLRGPLDGDFADDDDDITMDDWREVEESVTPKKTTMGSSTNQNPFVFTGSKSEAHKSPHKIPNWNTKPAKGYSSSSSSSPRRPDASSRRLEENPSGASRRLKAEAEEIECAENTQLLPEEEQHPEGSLLSAASFVTHATPRGKPPGRGFQDSPRGPASSSASTPSFLFAKSKPAAAAAASQISPQAGTPRPQNPFPSENAQPTNRSALYSFKTPEEEIDSGSETTDDGGRSDQEMVELEAAGSPVLRRILFASQAEKRLDEIEEESLSQHSERNKNLNRGDSIEDADGPSSLYAKARDFGIHWKGVGSDEDIEEGGSEQFYHTMNEDIEESESLKHEQSPSKKMRPDPTTAAGAPVVKGAFPPEFRLLGVNVDQLAAFQGPGAALTGPPSALLGQPLQRKKKIRGGYADMLKNLLAVQKSRTSAWQQAVSGDSPNLKLESSSYRIESLRREGQNITALADLLPAKARASDPPKALICVSDPDDVYSFAVGATVKVFPPWAQIPGVDGVPLIFARYFQIEEHNLNSQLPSANKPSSLFLHLRQFGSVVLHSNVVISRQELDRELANAVSAVATKDAEMQRRYAEEVSAELDDEYSKKFLTQSTIVDRTESTLQGTFHLLQPVCASQNALNIDCVIHRIYSTPELTSKLPPRGATLARRMLGRSPTPENRSEGVLWTALASDSDTNFFLVRLRDPWGLSAEWRDFLIAGEGKAVFLKDVFISRKAAVAARSPLQSLLRSTLPENSPIPAVIHEIDLLPNSSVCPKNTGLVLDIPPRVITLQELEDGNLEDGNRVSVFASLAQVAPSVALADASLDRETGAVALALETPRLPPQFSRKSKDSPPLFFFKDLRIQNRALVFDVFTAIKQVLPDVSPTPSSETPSLRTSNFEDDTLTISVARYDLLSGN